MVKNIILSIGKCFLYVLMLGICQSIALSILPGNVLLGTIFSSLLFIILVFCIAYVFKWETKKRLKINYISLKSIAIVIALAILANFAIQSVQFLFPESMRDVMADAFQSDFSDGKGIVSFLAIVVFAPFSEELLFRGLLFGELKSSTNLYVAGVLQALLFGIVHGNIIWGLIAFLSALFYVFLLERCDSIFAPIIGHMSVNLLAFIFM